MAQLAQAQDPAQTPDQRPDERIFLQPTGPWAAKVMDLEDTLKVFALMGEIMESIFAQEGGFRIAAFVRSLDKQTLVSLLEIATHQEPTWIEENFSFPKALKAVLDFWKRNELDELWGEVSRAGSGLIQKAEPETPAPDGSQSSSTSSEASTAGI